MPNDNANTGAGNGSDARFKEGMKSAVRQVAAFEKAVAAERRFVTREVRAEPAAGDKGGRITGYAAVWDEVANVADLFDEVVRRGAFTRSLADADDVVALFNHDANLVLGRTSAGTLELVEDDTGLRFTIQAPNTNTGRDLVETIRRGDVRGSSFAFRVTPEGQRWSFTGGNSGRELRELIDVRLIDVSPATYPTYAGTDAAVRSRDNWRTAHDAVEAERRDRALRLATAD